MAGHNEELLRENTWLRAELRKANLRIAEMRENNPLAERLGKTTTLLMEAVLLLRRADGIPDIKKFLHKLGT